MAAQQPSKALNITLWVVQILLAASLVWGACMKLFLPPEKLAAMWPWTAQIPRSLVIFTGIADLLGGLGLVLPGLLKSNPRLTYFAALGVIVLMIAASIFHISRGEGAQIAPNIIFALMAVFIAWGRR
jgi:uncharacterized membrane protein YphA (DoxX/SURF4 family)